MEFNVSNIQMYLIVRNFKLHNELLNKILELIGKIVTRYIKYKDKNRSNIRKETKMNGNVL